MNPLVSILIPSYNSEKYINRTINSALNQTYRNIEIIIVDDGSTDSTLKIINSFKAPNIKLIAIDHHGAAHCRNIALQHSQGKFIQFLDSDDLLHPLKINEQINYAKNQTSSRTTFLSSWGKFYSDPKLAFFEPTSLWQDFNPRDWLFTSYQEGIWMQPASFLLNREVCELAGDWDTRLTNNDDGEYFSRIICNSDYIKFIPNSICYYRIGVPNSLSSIKSNSSLHSLCLSVLLCCKNVLMLEISEQSKSACVSLLNKLIQMLTPYSYNSNIDEIISLAQKLVYDLSGTLHVYNEKTNYRIAKYLFGLKTATKLRDTIWRSRLLFNKYLEIAKTKSYHVAERL